VEVLKKELLERKVEIILNKEFKDILVEENSVKGVLFCDGKTIECDRVIIATGGLSYSFTGSTGDGMRLAEKSGHRIVAPRPGLVALVSKQSYMKPLEGLTLKNIRIVFSGGKKRIVSEIGEMLFTGSGISGPLVFTLSGTVVDWLDSGLAVNAQIDLKPGLSREQLDARLLREFRDNPKKSIRNVLKNLLPQSLIDVFLGITKIDPQVNPSHLPQEKRSSLAVLLKAFPVDIARAMPMEEAIVTRGGVSLKDIDPRTMESRIIKGLYFAGEMIDVDADTGGFNLQAAFSTGYLAGESAALN
jgi:hypothetical protein